MAVFNDAAVGLIIPFPDPLDPFSKPEDNYLALVWINV